MNWRAALSPRVDRLIELGKQTFVFLALFCYIICVRIIIVVDHIFWLLLFFASQIDIGFCRNSQQDSQQIQSVISFSLFIAQT